MTNPLAAIGSTGTSAAGYAAMLDSSSASGVSGSTGAATTSGSTPSGSSTSTASLLDPQAFLQLLVAQLKYQDPSKPVDTSSFMNQTAMLSQVQTMSSMSTTLSALADAQQAQSATGLIGKQVTYLDSHGMRASGVVSSADLATTGATVQVGDVAVPLGKVVSVQQAPVPAS